MEYQKIIKNLRTKLVLSQQEFAELLGVSFTSVNRWENDKYAPTKLVKVKLNQLFKEHNIEVKEVNE